MSRPPEPLPHLAAEDIYRVLVDQLPAITYLVRLSPMLEAGLDSPTGFISRQVESILGFTPEEWMGSPDLWIRQLHPEDRERVLQIVNACNKTRRGFDLEYRTCHKNGRTVVVFNSGRYLEGTEGALYTQGLIFDSTVQKRHVLREKLAAECVVHISKPADMAAAGPWLQALLEEVMPVSRLVLALRRDDGDKIVFPILCDTATTGPGMVPEVLSQVTESGLGFHSRTSQPESPRQDPGADWIAAPLQLEDTLCGVLAVETKGSTEEYAAEDLQLVEECASILAKRLCALQLQAAVHQSQKRIRRFFEHIPSMAVRGTNKNGTVVYWNSASTAFYGYSAEEAVGRNVLELVIPPERRAGAAQSIEKCWNQERQFRHLSGSFCARTVH